MLKTKLEGIICCIPIITEKVYFKLENFLHKINNNNNHNKKILKYKTLEG